MRYRHAPGRTYLGHGRWLRHHTPVSYLAARRPFRIYDQIWANRIGAFRHLFGTRPLVGGGGGPEGQDCWHVFRRRSQLCGLIDTTKYRPMYRGRFLSWWRE